LGFGRGEGDDAGDEAQASGGVAWDSLVVSSFQDNCVLSEGGMHALVLVIGKPPTNKVQRIFDIR
jgi:hypothetical protein